MDKLVTDTTKFIDSVLRFVQRELPVKAGRIAVDHFKENFIKEGFVNGGLNKWPPAKRLSSGSNSADAKHTTLMSSRNHLYNSIVSAPSTGKVTVYTDVIYAPIHNEGGQINIPITPKMRRFAWSRYYQLAGKSKLSMNGKKRGNATASENIPAEASKWKGLALTNKKSLTVNMPQRQFMGDSVELEKKIDRVINNKIQELLKL